MSSYSRCEHFTSDDDRRARVPRQHVAREQHQQLVAPDHAAAVVDDADAVGVAVEGDAELGARRAHARDSCCMFSTTVGSGWWFGKRPSGSQKSGVTRAPSRS